MITKNWFVYILLCNDGTLYGGCTDDIEKRVNVHNLGKGAKYTRGRLPVKVVYSEEVGSRSDALKREHQIKNFTREEKKNLILKNKTI